MKEFSLTLDHIPDDASDLLLDLDYDGNIAELFCEGQKVADQYSMGNGWHIALKRFAGATNFTLRLFALDERAPIYMDHRPVFQNGLACKLNNTQIFAEYSIPFCLPN